VLYTQPSRYHWMLQFYLRRQGLWLSWVGTGRMIFSLDFDEALFDQELLPRFVAAAQAMLDAGWWWQREGLSHQRIKRELLKEMLAQRLA
jgi:glutamate-1-semialdehyde 2,1-aminomutase